MSRGPKRRPPIERFMEKVRESSDGCWEWAAEVGNSGYGRFWVGGSRKSLAHRWAYEYYVSPIPEGLVIDHLCRNKVCVNPEHLEPVTTSVNVLRGDGPAIKASTRWKKTHCPKGHEYSEDNTHVSPRGDRVCITCNKARRKAEYARDRQGAIDKAREWRLNNPDRHRKSVRESQRRLRERRRSEA